MQRSFKLASQASRKIATEPSLSRWGFAAHAAMALIVIVLLALTFAALAASRHERPRCCRAAEQRDEVRAVSLPDMRFSPPHAAGFPHDQPSGLTLTLVSRV